MPQCEDVEMTPYNDDFGLLGAFSKYLTIPTVESHHNFMSNALGYYRQSPIDCIGLLKRYWKNDIFMVSFWRVLAGHCVFIHPTEITVDYSGVILWISGEIEEIFLNCCFEMSKFNTQLETISLMIKLAKRIASEVKSLGINEELIKDLGDKVIIWNYLIRKISIDFDKKTIDYYSLSQTINEISFIVKMDSSSKGPPMRLSKRYALLWLYLRHIYNNDCTVVFETHHHKALIIYLIMQFCRKFNDYKGNEFYSNKLRFLFEKLYENGSLKLVDPILIIFKGYSPKLERNLLGASEKISTYFELAHFLTEDSKKLLSLSHTEWRIKALAELELYLLQRYQKIYYSTH